MAAKKKPAIDNGSGSTPTAKDIEKRYGSKMPSGMRSLGKAGYVKSFQDVVAEGPWGTKKGDKAAKKVASKQWDRTFGPAANKPRKSKSTKNPVVNYKNKLKKMK